MRAAVCPDWGHWGWLNSGQRLESASLHKLPRRGQIIWRSTFYNLVSAVIGWTFSDFVREAQFVTSRGYSSRSYLTPALQLDGLFIYWPLDQFYAMFLCTLTFVTIILELLVTIDGRRYLYQVFPGTPQGKWSKYSWMSPSGRIRGHAVTYSDPGTEMLRMTRHPPFLSDPYQESLPFKMHICKELVHAYHWVYVHNIGERER
ncbi:hypothetical protein EDC04DRAFT_2601680 [Pisolithus marmoratus]|nr:hypothetical protein EDC04DRAFT_2601680 [Pisolithus marmoratus]